MFIGLLRWSLILIIFVQFGQTSSVKSPIEAEESVRQRVALEISMYLNKTADPCDNFYNFACGNWPTINPATRTQYETSVLQSAKQDLERKMTLALGNEENDDTDVYKNVKNFYQSCLNIRASNAEIYKDQLQQIAKEFGQMPVLEGDKWNENEFDWLRTVAEIAFKYDTRIILGYTIMVDSKNNSLNRLYIGHPDFPLKTPAMYLDNVNVNYRTNYQNVIAENLQEFLGLSQQLAEQTAKEIFDFEVSLVKGMTKYTVGGRELQSLTTIAKLDSIYLPVLSITQLLRLSLGSLPNDKIIEKNPGYQLHLLEMMTKTPKKTVANYIFYNLLQQFMLKTPKTVLDLETKCMRMTKTHFPYVLENMVYHKFSSTKMEQAVYTMFQDIKANFEKDFESQKYPWINEATRKLAVEKLKSMKLEINSYETFNFTQEYGLLSLKKHNFIENQKNIFTLNALKSRAKLNAAPRPYYGGAGMSFGPRYILLENTIKVPVAILQPDYFWSSSYPQSINFGRLGFLLAHEVIHGFDDEGQTFDRLGNERDWWDVKSARDFINRSQCFRNQYTKLAKADRPLPRRAWQSENIADNGGVRLAYDTYLRWQESALKSHATKELESLPSLSYSDKQLFFISFAQLWCNDILPDIRNMKMATDSHAPSNLRVIGALSNFDDFSKEFNCVRGRQMSPVEKCEIY